MASDQRLLLRERFVAGTATNIAFTAILVIALAVVLWPVAPQGPLLTWAIALVTTTTATWFVRTSNLSFERWYRSEQILQAIVGGCWGLISIIAMPYDEVHQTILIAALSAVVVASSAGESQFSGLYVAFLLPFGLAVMIGYFVFPSGSGKAGALFFIAILYAVFANHDDRKVHQRLVDLMVENEELVAQLAEERDALASTNEKLDRLAWTDTLTGLSNRGALERRLAELDVTSPALPLTVAYVDLNGFKAINDDLGHRVGDVVLVAVAERLQAVLEDGEHAYRWGGDEITVIGGATDLDDLGRRVASIFDTPVRIDSRVIPIGASIGIARAAEPSEEVLRRADVALYRNKALGDGGYEIWRPSETAPLADG